MNSSLKKNPKVTILMPVYNGENYLREAIDSILNQTLTDFEFLIINDGSTDLSEEIIRSYTDPRTRLVNNEINLGLIETLNKGIELSRGKYIARMDCDDISLPERLEKQFNFMEKYQEVGICGTWVETFGEVSGEIWDYPSDYFEIQARLLFESVLAHPSVMIRTELLKKNGLKYNLSYIHAEDYALWQRCSFCFPVNNIPEVLVKYRITSTSVSRTNSQEQKKTVEKIYIESLKMLGLNVNKEQLLLHQQIAVYKFPICNDFLVNANSWLCKLLDANEKSKRYSESSFCHLLGERWFNICYRSTSLGLKVMWAFRRSPLSSFVEVPFKIKVKFLIKCFLQKG